MAINFQNNIPSVIPPFKDQNQSRYKRGCSCESYIKFGSQSREKHGCHGDVFRDLKWTPKIIQYKDNLQYHKEGCFITNLAV